MASSKSVYDPPPPLHSKRLKPKPPKWFGESACLTEKQWAVLTQWCVDHFKSVDDLPIFQTVNIALCGLPKRNSKGEIAVRGEVKYEVPPADVPRSKIDSNSIEQAMNSARYQLKRKPKKRRQRG